MHFHGGEVETALEESLLRAQEMAGPFKGGGRGKFQRWRLDSGLGARHRRRRRQQFRGLVSRIIFKNLPIVEGGTDEDRS